MTLAEPQIRRWTKSEYYRLGEEGLFDGQRVQLINGEIIQMPPQGHRHAKAILRTQKALENAFGPNHWVRNQLPIDASDESQPEPDVAVTEQDADWYKDHPVSALLAVEVSDSTLRLDRKKASIYAAAGVPEYWIVNLEDRRLEVYRRPVADAAHEHGHRYADHQELGENESIAPLARPRDFDFHQNTFRMKIMALWLQYLLVALIVLGSITFIARQIWATLLGKKSKLGSCCSTGCAAHHPPAKESTTQRVQFLPAEMLGRKK